MFTLRDAQDSLDRIGIDIEHEGFDLGSLVVGMNIELEHGTRYPDLDVTGDDPLVSAKIALAHLREFPDYYERLRLMEREAEAAMALAAEEGLGIV